MIMNYSFISEINAGHMDISYDINVLHFPDENIWLHYIHVHLCDVIFLAVFLACGFEKLTG